jgi:hypothetical protein
VCWTLLLTLGVFSAFAEAQRLKGGTKALGAEGICCINRQLIRLAYLLALSTMM